MDKLEPREAAELMRGLSEDERNDLIDKAGSSVIDSRGVFEERHKQVDLARNYRRPKP